MANLNNRNRNDDFSHDREVLDPPAFTEPILDSCVRINSDVRGRNGTVRMQSYRVLVKNGGSAPFNSAGRLTVNDEPDSDGYVSSSSSESETEDIIPENEIAYLICDEIRKAIYGKVYRGIVLRRSTPTNTTDDWQMTNQDCAIKAMPWDEIRRGRARNQAENPEDEISAMQHLKQHLDNTRGRPIPAHDAMRETNIIMPLDFLFDEQNLYTITPFCTGGELFEVLQERRRVTEPEGRYLLRSILNGLESLQRAGLCHRDISLENIMVDNEQTIVIDLGMCLRIPFLDNEESDADMPRNVNYRDRSAHRCLIRERNRAGKHLYMAPEVYSQSPFDGHVVDMWSAGVCLFMMLTGQHAWEKPTPRDKLFQHISSNGELADILIKHWHIPLSEGAIDLLQRMLFKNPQDRLSLQQVRDHPWMDGPTSNPVNI